MVLDEPADVGLPHYVVGGLVSFHSMRSDADDRRTAVAQWPGLLVDRLGKNLRVNANGTVHEHHGDPANSAGYKFLVTAWSIEATGGPKCYIGHDMTAAREHLSIDPAGFDAVYLEIEATLFYLGAPDPETKEFMAIIESFVYVWALRPSTILLRRSRS